MSALWARLRLFAAPAAGRHKRVLTAAQIQDLREWGA